MNITQLVHIDCIVLLFFGFCSFSKAIILFSWLSFDDHMFYTDFANKMVCFNGQFASDIKQLSA